MGGCGARGAAQKEPLVTSVAKALPDEMEKDAEGDEATGSRAVAPAATAMEVLPTEAAEGRR